MRGTWHWLLASMTPAKYDLQAFPQALETWEPSFEYIRQNFPLWASGRCVLDADRSWQAVEAALLSTEPVIEDNENSENRNISNIGLQEQAKDVIYLSHPTVAELLSNVTKPAGSPIRSALMKLHNGVKILLQESLIDKVDRVAVVIEDWGYNADPPDYAELTHFSQRFASRQIRIDWPSVDATTTSTNTLFYLRGPPGILIQSLKRTLESLVCPRLPSHRAEAELLSLAAELRLRTHEHPLVEPLIQEAVGSHHWFVRRRKLRMEGLLSLVNHSADNLVALVAAHMGFHVFGKKVTILIRSFGVLSKVDTIREIAELGGTLPAVPQKTPNELESRFRCAGVETDDIAIAGSLDIMETTTTAKRERLSNPLLFTRNGKLSSILTVTVSQPRMHSEITKVVFPFDGWCSIRLNHDEALELLLNQLIFKKGSWTRQLNGNDVRLFTQIKIVPIHSQPWYRSGFLVLELPKHTWKSGLKIIMRLVGYFRALEEDAMTRVLENAMQFLPQQLWKFNPGMRCRPLEILTHPYTTPVARQFQHFLRRFIHPQNMLVVEAIGESPEDRAACIASLDIQYQRDEFLPAAIREFDQAIAQGEKAIKTLSPPEIRRTSRKEEEAAVQKWKKKRGKDPKEIEGVVGRVLISQRTETIAAAGASLMEADFRGPKIQSPVEFDVRGQIYAIPGKVPLMLLHQPRWTSTRHIMVLRIRSTLLMSPDLPEIRCLADALGATQIEGLGGITFVWSSRRSRALKKFEAFARSTINGAALKNVDLYAGVRDFCGIGSEAANSLAVEGMIMSASSRSPSELEQLYQWQRLDQTSKASFAAATRLWQTVMTTVTELELCITGPSTAMDAAKTALRICNMFQHTRAKKSSISRLPHVPQPPRVRLRALLKGGTTTSIGATLWLPQPSTTDTSWCFHKVMCFMFVDLVEAAATRLYMGGGFAARPAVAQQTPGLQHCRVTVSAQVPLLTSSSLPALSPAIHAELRRWNEDRIKFTAWRGLQALQLKYFFIGEKPQFTLDVHERSIADADWSLACAPVLSQAYRSPNQTLANLKQSVIKASVVEWCLEGEDADFMGLDKLPGVAVQVLIESFGKRLEPALPSAVLECKDERQCRLLFHALLTKAPGVEWREETFRDMRLEAADSPRLFFVE